jgi:hypothetical protein
MVIDALRMAWFCRRPQPGLIHHSDRGSQYCSHDFQKELVAYGMLASMSRKGNCWDNAPSESFFNGLKNERVHATREAFYNRVRRHTSNQRPQPGDVLRNLVEAAVSKTGPHLVIDETRRHMPSCSPVSPRRAGFIQWRYMNVTKLLGIILLAAGLFGLLYGHFDYTKETHEGQLGPFKFSIAEKETAVIPSWASVVVMVAGVVLLVIRK